MEEGQKERKEIEGRKRGRKGREGKETEEIPCSDLRLNMAVSGHDNWSEVANFPAGKRAVRGQIQCQGSQREERGKTWGF